MARDEADVCPLPVVVVDSACDSISAKVAYNRKVSTVLLWTTLLMVPVECKSRRSRSGRRAVDHLLA